MSSSCDRLSRPGAREHSKTIIKKVSLPMIRLRTDKTPQESRRTPMPDGSSQRRSRKRAFPCTSRWKGSLTVEAAMTVPMFLFVVVMMWTFFSVMVLHVRLQWAAEQVGGELAQQAFLLKEWKAGSDSDRSNLSGQSEGISLSSLMSDTAWKVWAGTQLVSKTGRSVIENSPVVGGTAGIQVLGSTWRMNGDLDLRIDYVVSIPVLPGVTKKLALTQHSLHRSWTGCQSSGSGDAEDKEEMVYITSRGSVYHRDISCYHLLLTVREVSAAAVRGQRNESGGGYTACERCAEGIALRGTVYIAREGDRYHSTRDCAGLKRSVKSVPLSQAGGRRPCSNCGS